MTIRLASSSHSAPGALAVPSALAGPSPLSMPGGAGRGGVRLRHADPRGVGEAAADAAPAQATAGREAAAPAVRATPEEKARRWFVFYVICVFWMIFAEGVLRKWVAPQYSNFIFFIRDPFLLLAYLQAVRAGQAGMSHPLMLSGMILGFFSLPLLALTVLMAGDPIRAVVGVYGWRAYFLYIPLPFLMMALFRREDAARLLRHVCLAIMISAPLVVAQFRSPANSIINAGIAEEESLQFRAFALTGDKIRPSGLFTSSAGQGTFVAATFGIVLGLFLYGPRQRPIGRLFMYGAGAAVLAALAFGGQRGVWILAILTLATAAFLALLTGSAAMRFKAITIPAIFAVGGIFLLPVLFPDAIEAMLKRVQEASASESTDGSVGSAIWNRQMGNMLDFLRVAPNTPFQGNGLGVGTNARRLIGDPPDLQGVYAESEWSRHFVDLGLLLGPLYIVFRLFLVGYLINMAWAAVRRGEHLPFVMLGFLLPTTLNGQITGHGSVSGIAWVVLGLALTLCQLSRSQPPGGAAVAPPSASPAGLPRARQPSGRAPLAIGGAVAHLASTARR